MGEKRFRVNDLVKFNYSEVGEYVDENHTDRPLRNDEVVDKLNEQQDTIFKLQDICGKSDRENMELRIENKRLEKEVNLLKPTNIEQYEQIQKLQKENEQLKIANANDNDYSNLNEISNKNSTCEDLTFGDFIKRHQYMNSIDVMTYELYLILKNLQRLTGE